MYYHLSILDPVGNLDVERRIVLRERSASVPYGTGVWQDVALTFLTQKPLSPAYRLWFKNRNNLYEMAIARRNNNSLSDGYVITVVLS